MQGIRDSGATIIFVNHGVDAIKKFCTHAIVLDHGRLTLDTTDIDLAIAQYLGEAAPTVST